jgi:hypothetical protein
MQSWAELAARWIEQDPLDLVGELSHIVGQPLRPWRRSRGRTAPRRSFSDNWRSMRSRDPESDAWDHGVRIDADADNGVERRPRSHRQVMEDR